MLRPLRVIRSINYRSFSTETTQYIKQICYIRSKLNATHIETIDKYIGDFEKTSGYRSIDDLTSSLNILANKYVETDKKLIKLGEEGISSGESINLDLDGYDIEVILIDNEFLLLKTTLDIYNVFKKLNSLLA